LMRALRFVFYRFLMLTNINPRVIQRGSLILTSPMSLKIPLKDWVNPRWPYLLPVCNFDSRRRFRLCHYLASYLIFSCIKLQNTMTTKINRMNKYKALYEILNQYPEAFEGEALASVQALGTLNDRLSNLTSNLTRPVNLVYQNRSSNRETFMASLQSAVKLGLAISRKTGNSTL